MKKYQCLVAVLVVTLAVLVWTSNANIAEATSVDFRPAYIQEGFTEQYRTSFLAVVDIQKMEIYAGITLVKNAKELHEDGQDVVMGLIPFKDEKGFGLLLVAIETTHKTADNRVVEWAILNENGSFLTTADGEANPGLYAILKLEIDGVQWNDGVSHKYLVRGRGQTIFTAHFGDDKTDKLAQEITGTTASDITGVLRPNIESGFINEAEQVDNDVYANVVAIFERAIDQYSHALETMDFGIPYPTLEDQGQTVLDTDYGKLGAHESDATPKDQYAKQESVAVRQQEIRAAATEIDGTLVEKSILCVATDILCAEYDEDEGRTCVDTADDTAGKADAHVVMEKRLEDGLAGVVISQMGLVLYEALYTEEPGTGIETGTHREMAEHGLFIAEKTYLDAKTLVYAPHSIDGAVDARKKAVMGIVEDMAEIDAVRYNGVEFVLKEPVDNVIGFMVENAVTAPFHTACQNIEATELFQEISSVGSGYTYTS